MLLFPIIFFLFVSVPIIEIYLLIKVGSAIGALATIGIVILTAFIGTRMLRSQGIATMNHARSRLGAGQIPAMELMEGLALGVGGALLLTPGFVTDAMGFACLVPVSRRAIIRLLSRRVTVAGVGGVAGGFTSSPDQGKQAESSTNRKPADVIEGEYIRKK